MSTQSQFFNNILSPSSFFVINKMLTKKVGLVATLLLTELLDISNKQNKENGFFQTTQQEIKDSTFLTIAQQQPGFTKLVNSQLLEIDIDEQSNVVYKVNYQNLSKVLKNQRITQQEKSAVKKPIQQAFNFDTEDNYTKKFNALIDLFKDVNPAYQHFFKQTNQRNALKRLIDNPKLGFAQIRKAIEI